MKKIITVLLSLMMVVGTVGLSAPAQADTRHCVTVAMMPQEVLPSHGIKKIQVKGPGRAFCVGWGNTSRYELKAWVVYKVGSGKQTRWITAPMLSSSTGPRAGDYYTPWVAGRTYRTYAQLTIKSSNSIVLKRYGIDQSAAITY